MPKWEICIILGFSPTLELKILQKIKEKIMIADAEKIHAEEPISPVKQSDSNTRNVMIAWKELQID